MGSLDFLRNRNGPPHLLKESRMSLELGTVNLGGYKRVISFNEVELTECLCGLNLKR